MLRSLFAVGATNKKAIVYSTDTGDPVATFVAKGGINAVAFSGAGANARLIAGTFTSDLQMWRVENDGGEAECELKYGDIVFCMAVGADGTRLAVGGAKAHVAVYAIEFPAPTAQMSMEFAPRGPDAFTANVREMYRVPLPGSANVLSVALDLDASLLVTAGEAKIVHVWDISEMPIPDRAPRCNMVASPLLASAGAKGAAARVLLRPHRLRQQSSAVYSAPSSAVLLSTRSPSPPPASISRLASLIAQRSTSCSSRRCQRKALRTGRMR